MKQKKPNNAVREPVQVYLDQPDRLVLEQAAAAIGLSKAEVLRRALRRYAAELLSEESPALAFLNRATTDVLTANPADVAQNHDEYLANWEMASWDAKPSAKKSGARGK